MSEHGGGVRRESPTPLYQQIAAILRERIHRGVFRPGERIPTEYDLCEEFGVSRISVRQALAELAHEGLLYRRRGSGTYVERDRADEVQAVRAFVAEEPWVPLLEAAASSFNADYPRNPLRLEVQILGRPELRSKILGAVGRGEAPDLALIDWPWVAEFAELHFLQRLDHLDERWMREFRADLFPAFVDEAFTSLYAIQPEANVSVIWFRRDWLDQAGEAAPGSWDELVRVARRFSGERRYAIAFAGGTTAGETTTYQLLPFLWAAGADLFVDGRVSLDERAVRAVQFLTDLVRTHRVAPPETPFFTWDEPARLFAQGRVAFAVGGSYEKLRIQETSGWDERAFAERVGCAPIPAAPGGCPATVAGGMAFVFFQQARHPDIAFDLVRRAASPSIVRSFLAGTGRCPTRRSVVRTLDRTQDLFAREIASILHLARPRPAIPQYSKVSEQFQIMVEAALTGQLTPSQAVDRAREIVRLLIT